MPRLEPAERSRAKTRKLKTGCLTCNNINCGAVRKVKCDEAKPTCLRCTSTGRRCDGYKPQDGFGAFSYSNLGIARIGSAPGSDARESRSLQFFDEKTLTQLQAFFPDELWGKLLPQVAYAHSAVRHALVALSGYHERYVNQSCHLEAFTASQYSLAIKELTGAESSWQIHLISCLIFICIEILQGQLSSATDLFSTGYRLIQELRERPMQTGDGIWSAASFDGIISSVERHFHRLAVQIWMLTGQVAPDMPAAVVAGYLMSDIPRRTSFKTLTDAREELPLLVLAQYAVVYMDEVERQQYQHLLDHWSQRFDELLASKNLDQPTPSERRKIALLRLHRASMSINLSNVATGVGAAARNVMMWDDFLDVYNSMLHDAAIALGLDDEQKWGQLDETAPAPKPAPQFHLEFGVLTAILTVIVKCRDPLVRRKALSLMLAAPSQEGVWNSVMLARVTRRLIALEEDGRQVLSCSDIPKEARITELLAFLSPSDTRARIQFVFEHSVVEEFVCW